MLYLQAPHGKEQMTHTSCIAEYMRNKQMLSLSFFLSRSLSLSLSLSQVQLRGASFDWLTCRPPSAGLCWGPLLAPAQLRGLRAPHAPAGDPGPVAHRQPYARL